MQNLDFSLPTYITDKKGLPPTIYTKYQFLAWKFLKNPNNCNWSGELKISGKLFNRMDDFQFWRNLELGFKLNSLAWFLTAAGQEKLRIEINKHTYKPAEMPKYELSDTKQGEDVFIEKQPKTTLELLK